MPAPSGRSPASRTGAASYGAGDAETPDGPYDDIGEPIGEGAGDPYSLGGSWAADGRYGSGAL